MTAPVAIVIEFSLSEPFGTESERTTVFGFEDALILALAETNAGEVDGNGFGEHAAEVFAYSSNPSAVTEIATRIAWEMGLTATISVHDD